MWKRSIYGLGFVLWVRGHKWVQIPIGMMLGFVETEGFGGQPPAVDEFDPCVFVSETALDQSGDSTVELVRVALPLVNDVSVAQLRFRKWW